MPGKRGGRGGEGRGFLSLDHPVPLACDPQQRYTDELLCVRGELAWMTEARVFSVRRSPRSTNALPLTAYSLLLLLLLYIHSLS